MKAERRSGALSLERAGNDRAYVDWFELAADSVVVAPVLAWRSGVRSFPQKQRFVSASGVSALGSAYPDPTGGLIWVRIVRTEKNLVSVSVRDDCARRHGQLRKHVWRPLVRLKTMGMVVVACVYRKPYPR